MDELQKKPRKNSQILSQDECDSRGGCDRGLRRDKSATSGATDEGSSSCYKKGKASCRGRFAKLRKARQVSLSRGGPNVERPPRETPRRRKAVKKPEPRRAPNPWIDFDEPPGLGSIISYRLRSPVRLTLKHIEPYVRVSDGEGSFVLWWQDRDGRWWTSGLRGTPKVYSGDVRPS